ncbi:type 2 lanthipeptide synthetase LanM family protein [Herbidospora yilanensis]|uniref:type 2 lanthipeptide synthetase LanM family protein n=1 Tax=Herbidospora yilanensis TaxID=354426 RepID=UPI000782E0CD|nr:type 2 lanthipeptide synthetase LanM family protein [Herbidospora yilanensis]
MTHPFSAVVEPVARRAADRLVAAYPGAAAFAEAFAADLVGRLSERAAPALAVRLAEAGDRGELPGATPEERYAGFARRAAREPDPAVADLADLALRHAMELLDRFRRDERAVRGLMPGEAGGPVAFSAAGDPHSGGRSVSVVRFASGARVVYRPRPVEAHLCLNAAIGWLNGRVPGLGLRTLRVVAREEHGWVEFAEARPCASAAEVARFHRRMGALLALAHALDTIDLHFENVVAAGDQPVVVDAETLFHPVLSADAADPAHDALVRSVDRTAILPRLLIGDQAVQDVSALGGDPGVHAYSGIVWEDRDTDLMRPVRGPRPFAGAANRPRLDGRPADPAAYVDDLVGGFRAAYDAIAEGRHDLDRLLFPRFGPMRVRLLLRPTRIYSELLWESALDDSGKRALSLLMELSGHDALQRAAAPFEAEGINSCDVPYFWTSPDSLTIYAGDGIGVPWKLARTGRESVGEKLTGLGPADRGKQEWIIRASLATRAGAPSHDPKGVDGDPPRPDQPSEAETGDYLAAAVKIADELLASAHRRGAAVNWLGLEADDEGGLAVMPLGGGLASGYLGVALFLAQAGTVTGRGDFLETARQALSPSPALLDALAAEPLLAEIVGCGGFGGLGGMAYGLAQIGHLLGDAEVLAWSGRAVELAEATISERSALDVHDGLAGCLAAMLAIGAETVAAACADLLTGRDLPPDLPDGFAFGRAGIAWALGRYGLDVPIGPVEGHTWCGGLLTRRTAPPSVLLPDDSLCHGRVGRLGVPELQEREGPSVLASLRRHGARCATPGHVSTPGLLLGLAGIGHGLLRLAAPGQIPSVLLLHPFREATKNR